MTQSELDAPSERHSRGCFALIALVLLAAVVFGAFQTGYLPIRFFDSAEWKAANFWDGTRVEMIEHLEWSGKLNGLNRSEVIELLGPETDTAYASEFDLVYALGPERGLISLDSEWLVIDFGKDGLVANYEVVRD